MPREEQGYQEVLRWYLCEWQGCHRWGAVSSLLLSVSLLGKPVLDRTGGHPFCAVFFGQSITDFTNSSVLYCFRMLCNWRGAPMLLSLFVRLFSCSNSPTYLSRSWLTPWWKSLMWTLLPVLFSCPCKSVDVVAHLVTRMCKVTHLFCWQWTWTWTWTCIVARQKQGSCL